ncbi:hypothetical protein GCM10009037_05090 [Halarchaeum grantii]|uniref:GINS subunit domain-containing protein n=1 Tax=Halarchaeum grantii TaxID=1193105 RepID=A0A830F9L8_9EURY|nr:hypothetical protein [Halarchaeum grantii]GGL24535.1 hypothetical protein GCM10009037_05090 [Halarchaeum grantii]
MNIEELRAAQTRERTSDGLQDLRDSFYQEVADYIGELRERRRQAAEAADDPFGDDEVQSLTDEIETAEQVAEAIYERRMGKIVKQASLAAAGMGSDAEGLTEEERALYTDLVERIEENKSHVLDVLAGDADAATSSGPDAHAPPEGDASPDPADVVNDRASGMDAPSPPPEEPTTGSEDAGDVDATESDPSTAAAAMGGGEEFADADPEADAGAGPPPDASGDAGDEAAGDADDDTEAPRIERATVRITRDIGEIYGVDDRTYTLEADDVVTLPEENVDPLVERDAAERLD